MKTEKKKVSTLTKAVIITGVYMVLFNAMMFITFWRFQSYPEGLCAFGNSAGILELLAAAWIQNVDKKQKKFPFSNTEDDT